LSRRQARKALRRARRGRNVQNGPKPPLFSWARLCSVPRKKLILRSLLVLFIAIAIPCGWLGWKFYRNVAKITHNNNPLNLLSVFHPVPLKNQDGRVNILVAGDSTDRTDGSGGGDLTDSIMVLSLDTKNHTAFMLSIPRDLWVQLPGWGHEKINAAHEETNFNQTGYPAGGMGALEKVITDDLGIPINYYSLVNYSAFRDTVDALKGVTVTIQSPDPRGLYDPQPYNGARAFKLPNGTQTLDGQQALNLARARGEAWGSYGFPHSDFDRTEHQRQLVLAIKDKATSGAVLSDPLKVGQLADAIGKNVQTDMKLDEIETLYSIVKQVSNTSIQSVNINDLIKGQTLLANYTAPSGEEALIPAAGMDDFSQIRLGVKRLLSNDPVVKESATVAVLNGTDVTGLAKQQAAVLTNKGMQVLATSTAVAHTVTTIVDKSGGQEPNTLAALKELYPKANVVASDPSATGYTVNFVVILGPDQAPASSSNASSTTSTSPR